MPASTKDVRISIPATAHKGWEKGAEWVVNSLATAPIYGRGTSLPVACSDASDQLATLVQNVSELPAVVRDDDGGLWIFTAHADGYRGMRIRPDDTTQGCSMVGSGSPSAAADSIVRNHAGAVRLA